MILESIEKKPADRWIALALGLVTVAPIWAPLARALDDGWLAVGGDAIVLLRSPDVLTAHHPLRGALLLDLFALPARLADDTGLVVAVAVLHTACVAGIGLVLLRVGGARTAATGLAAAAALLWATGGGVLVDPWQPHVVLLPFLLFLALVWAMGRGSAIALPAAGFVGSLVVQAQDSYAATRVAHVEGLTPEERMEPADLERRLGDLDVRLDSDGRAARAAGALPAFERGAPSTADLLATGELSVLIREGLLHVSQSRRLVVEGYADLRHRWDHHTVAVFLDER